VSVLLCLLLASCGNNLSSWTAESPDGTLRVELGNLDPSNPGQLYYTVFRNTEGTSRQIMDLSPLGIIREDARFIERLEVVSGEEEYGLEDSYTLLTGKRLRNQTVFNQLRLNVKNWENDRMSLEFRVYNYGLAFRYVFEGNSDKDVRILEENSGFDFAPGSFWAHPYDTITPWSPAYETYYSGPMPVGTRAPGNKNGWAFPLLVESRDHWFLVSESGLDGSYGASHIQPECGDGRYMIRFAEQGEAEGYYENTSHSILPWKTPWRFIVIGSSLHEIIEASMSTDLAAPLALDQTGWIRPGRASWSWWSDSHSPRDYKRLVRFVDFAAEMGWEYSLVDAGWNRMDPGTVEQLADYAGKREVGLLVWYNSGGKHNVVNGEPRDLMDDRERRRSEFQRISSLGIKGVKVDFFQSDKQQIIRQYLDILEDAADFRLLVNFHGCTLPRGWRRTFPNLMSMEAIRGGECYKFDSSYPEAAPAHLAILPFTRNAVGPVDYTPGGFSDQSYPHLTTFGFELALPVILESGIMHYTDTPEMTGSFPPFVMDFLKNIPVVWDDTRYIAGYPGKDVILARKNGETWYLAGINGENITKDLTIDLSCTGISDGTLHLIRDGASARELQESAVDVAGAKVTLHMEPFGGFVGTWK
jgi:alpha-glucosidase